MDKNKNVIYMVAVIVLLFISFFVGMKYGQSKNIASSFPERGNFSQNGFNQNGGTRNAGQGMMRGGVGGGLVSGTILSKDDKSITVQLRDGGSKIVLFSPTTKVEKTVDGTSAEVIVGKQVMIMGTPNTDGSVNATSIQMRPIITPSSTSTTSPSKQ